MKTSDLESVLDAQNQIILKECFESPTSKGTDYASGSDYPKGTRKSRHFVHPCGGGMMKGRPQSCKGLERHIILQQTSPPPVPIGSVAVGWVLDDESANSNDDLNLDVVVAVGINYGQGGQYLLHHEHRTSKTDMRPRLNRADTDIAANPVPGCTIRRLPTDFHLVVGNLFPWITSLAWSQYEFNAIEEALLLHCFGYPDPLDPLDKLLTALGSTVSHVVFHGAKNAVPLLGTQFVTAKPHLLQVRPIQVLFCDNLARPHLPIANAVGLCL